MKRTFLILLAAVVGVLLGREFPVEAQDTAAAPPPSAPAKLGTAELEKLVMPIALHPDPLIATLLPASVYPLEIVQAARFVKDTNNVAKVDEQPWDDTVKAVAKIPALIAQLDADIDWTMKLGQAFLNQPKDVLDTIQELRVKANTAGTLRTTPQQVVVVTNVVVMQTNVTQVVSVTNQIVQVQSSSPEVVYVPSYPPTAYYPPPGYVYDPYAPLITFGVGMAMGAIIANNCDWHGGGVWCGGGDVDIDIDRNVNRNTNRNSNRTSSTGARSGQSKWQPNQSRLNSSGAPSASSQAARGYGSGTGGAGARPSTGMSPSGARPSTGAASPGARPSTGAASPAARPSAGTSYPGGGAGASANRSAPGPSAASTSRDAGGSAFGGVNSGSSSRESSNRGASSRGSSGGGGGGGRGGGGGGRRR